MAIMVQQNCQIIIIITDISDEDHYSSNNPDT